MKITFLGAVGEVTGSRYLVENESTKLLVDCGLFQGEDAFKKNTWKNFSLKASDIDAVVLTHAHIDHSGYIPVLVKNGFKGKIYCSKPTYALCAILLVDSGHLQEIYAKKHEEEKTSYAFPMHPLYTVKDAEYSLHFFQTINYDTEISVGSLSFKLIRSGHILGSSFVMIYNGSKLLTFSGDLGRLHQLIIKSPPSIKNTDYLVLESTYGNRLHKKGNPLDALSQTVKRTIQKGGTLLIPAFAVGRTQTILYYLFQLLQQKSIPNIPIFLDSPMAISVTELYCAFNDEHTLSRQQCRSAFSIATYTRSVEESKKIDKHNGPTIVLAGSGMANGGRILDHFKHFISDAKNTILFVGFQANGTHGRDLVDGSKQIEINDKLYPVHAEIEYMEMFSAHADYNDILKWLGHLEKAPQKVFLTHGETEAVESLQQKIKDRFGWDVEIPQYLESFELD